MITEHLTVFAPVAGLGACRLIMIFRPYINNANDRYAGSEIRIRLSALSSVNFAVPLEWFREQDIL